MGFAKGGMCDADIGRGDVLGEECGVELWFVVCAGAGRWMGMDEPFQASRYYDLLRLGCAAVHG
jgi:hypothetical protein